ncbi:unnamed protein product, partial [Musa acuminata var. zebrina]
MMVITCRWRLIECNHTGNHNHGNCWDERKQCKETPMWCWRKLSSGMLTRNKGCEHDQGADLEVK